MLFRSGQGVLPLILRHLDMPRENIIVITAEERGQEVAETAGVDFRVEAITAENFRAVLDPVLGKGDFLLNLSVEVSSVDLIEFCVRRGAMYLDTCIEPWLGGYYDTSISASRRSNYGLREEVVALRRKYPNGSTVIPTHGANPGLISQDRKSTRLNSSH